MLTWLRWRRDLKHRNIFRYWDGEKMRAIDPLMAWRYMWENELCNPAEDFIPATSGGEGQPFDPKAQDRVLAMTRQMFGLKQWTETSSGLTVDETLLLLSQFVSFMADLKKKHERSPTSSQPTEANSCETPSESTPLGSESSSIKSESTNGEHSSSSKRSIKL